MNKYSFAWLLLFLTPFTSSNSFAQSTKIAANHPLIGIWATTPTDEGLTTVMEFLPNGQSKSYLFNCFDKTKAFEDDLIYNLDEKKKTIHLNVHGSVRNVKINNISKENLSYTIKINDVPTDFLFAKTDESISICSGFFESHKDQLDKLSFKPTDFISNPWIPPHKNINRYVGRWIDGKTVQVAIKEDNGKFKVYLDSNENWNYLYNNVHWQGNELYFDMYAYSDNPKLYRLPFHKTQYTTIIKPINDPNKIKMSFFIDNERHDYILKRE